LNAGRIGKRHIPQSAAARRAANACRAVFSAGAKYCIETVSAIGLRGGMTMIRLNDIAERAGVNVSTVSRVLNHAQGIGEETREHVFRVAEELGYKAKRRNRRGNTIGVIVPELASQYYSELVHTLESRIREKGYNMLVALSDFDSKKVVQDFETMENNEVSGIICATLAAGEDLGVSILQAAEKTGIPVVFLADGGKRESVRFDFIYLNQLNGIELVIDHLVSLGHTRIGFVGEYHSTPRLKCFEQVMKEKGLFLDQRLVKMGVTRFEYGGYEQMKLLLAEAERPTAVIAAYDQFAFGALKAIEEAGLKVPDDISVVGFDNIVTCEFLPKKLTSVTNPVGSMGQIAIRLLFSKLFPTTDDIIQNVSLQPALIVRETTKNIRFN
jgi:LacI family transcriptional regulator